jgi:hypothetical protein
MAYKALPYITWYDWKPVINLEDMPYLQRLKPEPIYFIKGVFIRGFNSFTQR